MSVQDDYNKQKAEFQFISKEIMSSRIIQLAEFFNLKLLIVNLSNCDVDANEINFSHLVK